MYICDECVDLCNDIIREEIKKLHRIVNAVRYRRRMKFAPPGRLRYRPGTGEKSAGGRGYNHYKRLRNGDTSNGVELGKVTFC